MDLSGNFPGQEQQEHVVAKKLGKQTTLNIDHKFRYINVVFFKCFFNDSLHSFTRSPSQPQILDLASPSRTGSLSSASRLGHGHAICLLNRGKCARKPWAVPERLCHLPLGAEKPSNIECISDAKHHNVPRYFNGSVFCQVF